MCIVAFYSAVESGVARDTSTALIVRSSFENSERRLMARFKTFVTVPGTAAGPRSTFRRFFEEEALGQERRRDVLGILRGHAAREEMLPPVSNGCYHIFDFLPCRFGCQPEPLAS